jgi:chromosome segregation ATPase
MHRDQLERELATVTREMDLAADQLKGTCSLNRLLREEKDKLARERDGFKARVQEFDDAMCDEISHHIDTREERDTARAELAAVTAQRDAAKEEIECLKRELGSFKRRAWSAESMLETRYGLRREIAEALGVSAETGDDALRVGLETIRNLVQERDALWEQKENWRMSSVCRQKYAELKEAVEERHAIECVRDDALALLRKAIAWIGPEYNGIACVREGKAFLAKHTPDAGAKEGA